MHTEKILEQDEMRSRGWRFHFRSDNLSLNFVATVAGPFRRVNERLTTPVLLSEWLERAGVTATAPAANLQDLEQARHLREAIARLADAHVGAGQADAGDIETINRFASRSPPSPRLAANGRSLESSTAIAVQDLLSEIARDAVVLFGTVSSDRIRKCGSPRCPIYFVDHSRGNNRRWCSKSPCADQESSRQYRARKKRLTEQAAVNHR